MIRIPLTQGMMALVDDCDAHLAAFRWFAKHSHRAVYAVRWDSGGGKRRMLRLHREIMGAAPGVHIDHRNGDGLDCRRANLRFATVTENNRNARRRVDNSSGFRGVRYQANARLKRPWIAEIRRDGIRHYLGCYASAEDAAHAYDDAARALHGEFASLNFPEAA